MLNSKKEKESNESIRSTRNVAEKSNLDTMKINHAISPLEDTSKIRKTRKDIALMITILAEKERQN